MSERTPRHRAPQSAQVRRAEREGLLALISLPFLLAFLSRLTVRTDDVLLLLVVSVIGAAIGTWIGDKRKARRRQRADGTQRARL